MGFLLFIIIVFSVITLLLFFYNVSRRKRKLSRIQAQIDSRRERKRDNWDTIDNDGLEKHGQKRLLTRKHAKPEIDKFLDVKRKTGVIVFDVETNGLNHESSILSCSAIKFEYDPSTNKFKECDIFNRYYYPIEPYNLNAISINGLTKEVIDERRGEANYPKYFTEDNAFETFCNGVSRIVAHNISFDVQFVPFMKNKKKFCTMMTNMDIVAVQYFERKKEWKWPKLSETACYYGLSFSNSELHNSMYDVDITSKVFLKMFEEAQKYEKED
jgi:DNA polymerase-3 subunit epsilon